MLKRHGSGDDDQNRHHDHQKPLLKRELDYAVDHLVSLFRGSV
jgi:hypothetical protein